MIGPVSPLDSYLPKDRAWALRKHEGNRGLILCSPLVAAPLGAPRSHGNVPKKLELGVSKLFLNHSAENILEALLDQASKLEKPDWGRGVLGEGPVAKAPASSLEVCLYWVATSVLAE